MLRYSTLWSGLIWAKDSKLHVSGSPEREYVVVLGVQIIFVPDSLSLHVQTIASVGIKGCNGWVLVVAA